LSSSRFRLSTTSLVAAGLILVFTAFGVAAAFMGRATTVAKAAPYLRLAAGVVLAVAVAVTIEVVVRRERYAARVAAERTAELEASREALVRSERLSAGWPPWSATSFATLSLPRSTPCSWRDSRRQGR
jgi:cytochrome c biogenesis protein CcdA